MARVDVRAVRLSVRRLAGQYRLTPLGRRQLRIFFEIIIGELTPDRDTTVTPEAVERFMRRIANSTDLQAGRISRAGQTFPFPDAVTASDLLHAWQNLRNFDGGRSLLQGQSTDPDERQVAAILDKD